MTRRTNHYEAAFEAWLHQHQVPCFAIDESRRSRLGALAAERLSVSASADPIGTSNRDDDIAQSSIAPSSADADSGGRLRTLKNVDFIVSAGRACSWLVDVKGRRFPSGQSRYWMNWTTRDELHSLARWEELFGPRFTSLFVFAYHVLGDRAPLPEDQLYYYRGAVYAFVGIRLDHYLSWCRPLNAKWDTVTVNTSKFRELAQSAGEIFGVCPRACSAAAPVADA